MRCPLTSSIVSNHNQNKFSESVTTVSPRIPHRDFICTTTFPNTGVDLTERNSCI